MTSVIELTQRLVRIPSLTPVRPELYPVAQQTLDLLEDFASHAGAVTHRLPAEGNHARHAYRVDNLYAEWCKGNPRRFLVFMGHTDVVEPGNTAAWSTNPFGGLVHGDHLYGRGTTDMKGAVAAFFTAIARAVATLDDVHVAVIVTTDEEWAAVNGSRHVLWWMKSEGKTPHGFVVAEPSSQARFGTHIKVGRRGSLNGHLLYKGVQGHAAYPGGFRNPNPVLALAAQVVSSLVWNDGTPLMPATNLEVVSLQAGNPGATAIIPGEARAYWNIRFTPVQKPEALVKLIRKTLRTPPAWARRNPFAEHLRDVEVVPNLDSASLPYLRRPGPLARAAVKVLRGMGCQPEYDASGGTTDGRFVVPRFPKADLIELGPPETGGYAGPTPPDDFGRAGGMHQVDERILVADLHRLEEAYFALIGAYCKR